MARRKGRTLPDLSRAESAARGDPFWPPESGSPSCDRSSHHQRDDLAQLRRAENVAENDFESPLSLNAGIITDRTCVRPSVST